MGFRIHDCCGEDVGFWPMPRAARASGVHTDRAYRRGFRKLNMIFFAVWGGYCQSVRVRVVALRARIMAFEV